jgi:hypothetical protein
MWKTGEPTAVPTEATTLIIKTGTTITSLSIIGAFRMILRDQLESGLDTTGTSITTALGKTGFWTTIGKEVFNDF